MEYGFIQLDNIQNWSNLLVNTMGWFQDSKPNKNGALSSDRRQSSLDHNAEIYGANKETEEFLPMDLIHWEDDIIIDSEEARKKASKFLIIDKVTFHCSNITTI